MNYEPVSTVLKRIDEAISKALLSQKNGLRLGETKEEWLRRFTAEIIEFNAEIESNKKPSATAASEETSVEKENSDDEFLTIDHRDYPDRLVCSSSLKLAWDFCEQAKEIFVSKSGGQFQKVLTEGFGASPQKKTSFTNQYFNITTGMTISAFSVEGSRGGSVDEVVFLRTNQLCELIEAIERGEPEAFFNIPPARKLSKRELEREFRAWVATFTYPEKPLVEAREAWAKERGANRDRCRQLVRDFAPDYWSITRLSSAD